MKSAQTHEKPETEEKRGAQKPFKAKKKTRVGKDKQVKRKEGRPTDFKQEYCQIVYRMCLLGATDKEIATAFSVVEKTIDNWKKDHPGFLQSMRDGKDGADEAVADSLYQRAKGYSHPEVHVSNYQGAITLTKLTKHYPPDTAAASLWLRNRQSAKWRDKVELVGGSLPGDRPVQHDITISAEESYRRMLDSK